MIRLFLIGIIAVLMLQYTTGEAKTTSEFYQEGEELTYEVSYFGIKLGSIKVYSNKVLKTYFDWMRSSTSLSRRKPG